MKLRRTLCIALCMLLIGSFAGTAAEAATVRLNFCHFMAAMHPLNRLVLQPFADEVEEKTDGRVQITIFPSNELAAADKNYDAVVTGVIDMGLVLPAYTPGLFPLMSILEFPFMFSSSRQVNLTAAELFDNNPAILEGEYKDVEVLWLGGTDLGHFLLKRPIRGIADLDGMKMRSPSTIYNDVLAGLGAVPVSLPVSDTYDAIERSIVDGTVLPISTLISFNLSDVVEEVFEMNMYTTPLHFIANKSSWARISADDQKIIRDLLADFPAVIGALYDHETELGYTRAEEAGIEVVVPTADELAKFKEAVEPLIDVWLNGMEANGVPGREIYNQMREIAAKYE